MAKAYDACTLGNPLSCAWTVVNPSSVGISLTPPNASDKPDRYHLNVNMKFQAPAENAPLVTIKLDTNKAIVDKASGIFYGYHMPMVFNFKDSLPIISPADNNSKVKDANIGWSKGDIALCFKNDPTFIGSVVNSTT